MSRHPEYVNKIVQYPIIQGYLEEDSICELCSTGKHKTTFTVKTLSENIIPCVYWQFLPTIKKGQLVILSGRKKNDVFICVDVKQINRPYEFASYEKSK